MVKQSNDILAAALATSQEKVADLRAQLASAQQDAGRLRAAAKAFYNATVADSEVRISSTSELKRDIAAQAAEGLRTQLTNTTATGK